MGREIRRVPPGWEHPRYTKDDIPFYKSDWVGTLRPCHDKDFGTAIDEWIEEYEHWKCGEHPDQGPDGLFTKYHSGEKMEFWEYHGGPPRPEWYRPKFTEEPTWFQVYETVSEGTPITPPFATPEELIEHLATVGTEWDDPWSRENAEQFVRGSGWAPSFVAEDGVVRHGYEVEP